MQLHHERILRMLLRPPDVHLPDLCYINRNECLISRNSVMDRLGVRFRQ